MLNKSECSVEVSLKRMGDGMGSGYPCKIIRNDKVVLYVVIASGSPEQAFNTIVKRWDYYTREIRND